MTTIRGVGWSRDMWHWLVNDSGSGRWRRVSSEGVILGAVVLVFAAVQLISVSTVLELGNGGYYIRDAAVFADGELARSRYSPGFPFLLAPILWATGGDPGQATAIAEIVMAGVAVGALLVTHRFLLRHISSRVALALVAALALGQAGLTALAGVNAEPIALALVASTLLLGTDGRSGIIAGVLSGIAVAVRVAVAPFFAVLWLVRLRRHPTSALLALGLIALAGLAHFGSGPLVDQSYLDIAEGVYDGSGSTLVNLGTSALGQVGEGIATYGRYGIPRLVWPFRVLDLAVGLPIAIVTLGLIVWGMARRTIGASRRIPIEAIVGTVFYMGLLMVWPVRVSEAVRLVMPVAPVLLAGLGVGIDRVATLGEGRSVATRVVSWAMIGLVVVNLGAGASLLAQNRGMPQDKADFFEAHRLAVAADLSGPVISRKPAVSELMLGIPGLGYPLGDPTAAEFERFVESVEACSFVVDGLGAGEEVLFSWVEERADEIHASVGRTSIVSVANPWCG